VTSPLRADDADAAVLEKERHQLLQTLLGRAGRPEAERITPALVRRAFGNPRNMARQLLYQRYLEQWAYGPPLSLRLEFDLAAGQPPRLINVERLQADTR
jgi:hypothetical protein